MPFGGVSNVWIGEVQDTQDAIRHPRDRLDPMEGLALSCREVGQASQLGKRVGQVVAMGIDNGHLYVLALAVEEEEVGTHPLPVVPSVLVRDSEGIARRACRVPIPSLESVAAHLSVEDIDLPLVQRVDGEVAVVVGHEVAGPGLKLVAVPVLGLLGANAGPFDLGHLGLGRHALDLVVDGAAFVQ